MLDSLNTAIEKTKPNGKFRWRKYIILLLGILTVGYLLLLLVMNTSWGKNKLISPLNSKTKCEWRVGRILWNPFGNIEFNNLQTKMGGGEIMINSLNLSPSWRDLYSRKLKITEASIEAVEIDLDLNWLKKHTQNVIQPSDTEHPKPHIIKTQKTKPKKGRTNTNPTGKPIAKPSQGKPTKPIVKEIPKVDSRPNRWLNIKKMNLTLRNDGLIIGKIADITASIPYFGKPAEGSIQWEFENDKHTHKMQWDGRQVTMKEEKGKLMNLDYQWKVLFQRNHSSIPFALFANLPQQSLNYSLDYPNLHLRVSADELMGVITMNGDLKNPNTWRGLLNIVSNNLRISETQKTHKEIEFDKATFTGSMGQGRLHIPLAEAIGHKTSILANGVIQKNLYSYGVIRLIANKEAERFYERAYHGSKFITIDEHRHNLLTPLDTPDRKYCDFHIDGILTNLELCHNRGKSWKLLRKILQDLLEFKNDELNEDGLLETKF